MFDCVAFTRLHPHRPQTIMTANGDAMRIGLVAGLTFFALTYMLYSTSGAHLNPAVTLGIWASRRMTTLRAFCYISACSSSRSAWNASQD